MNIVWTILILGVMIFVHEAGHLISAKAFNVRVHEFAMGMGPKLFGWGKGETKYSIRLFPIGGFCKMEGEDEASDDPRSISKLPAYKRIVVMAAGAFMNILLAFILYVVLSASAPSVTLPVVESVSDNANIPLKAGDKIVKIDNTRVNIIDDFLFYLQLNPEKEVTLTVKRDGELIKEVLKPYYNEETGRYVVGFRPKTVSNNLWLVLKEGIYQTIFGVKYVYYSLGMILRGQVGLSEMSGPVGIVSVVGDVVAESKTIRETLLNLMSFAALIGVNLGVMNLLPLPALDGGRIIFCLIEMVRRKPIKPEVEGYIHFAGLVLLLLLMLLVTGSDILKLFA